MATDFTYASNPLPFPDPSISRSGELGLLRFSTDDPILPWLSRVKNAVDDFAWSSGGNSDTLMALLEECIRNFKGVNRYHDDIRFLKILVIYGDMTKDFPRVFEMMNKEGIGQSCSFVYEAYAVHLELMGRWKEAHHVYLKAMERNASSPVDRLRKMHMDFIERMKEAVRLSSEMPLEAKEKSCPVMEERRGTNPWSQDTLDSLLERVKLVMGKYNGYYRSTKSYCGKIPSTSSKNFPRNMIVELGSKKYQIKGCAGKGGFAQVMKAHLQNNPEEVVALKIQKPAFPWEFYMYRQLDKRIPAAERLNFGVAQKMHLYSDCSVLVCNYLEHGTIQDVVNSYLVTGQLMDEVLCIYYTIEMLHMLEVLHSAGIIHGDFKPDNLLIRYASDYLDEKDFFTRTGSWKEQGLCLVDWGRGIDLNLFPTGTMFLADCRTSGFRCVEMQEGRPWLFQVDTYGLCGIVHVMLHGKYMEITKKASTNEPYEYQPKLPLKRYWNKDLWSTLFTRLLNFGSTNDVEMLGSSRRMLQDYLKENPQLIKKLEQLLARQRTSLCSAK